MDLIEVDAPKSFIAGAKIPEEVCDGLVDFYNTCDYLLREPGSCGHGVDKKIKDSIDMTIPVHLKDKRVQDYLDQLGEVTIQYINRYPFFGKISWDLISPFNVQKYEPGGGFFQMHTEKMASQYEVSQRVMAWMTYLNTVDEGGYTYFPTQEAKIKPVKGLTILWPADWTHFHQGIPAPNETKIIATGWYDYTMRPVPPDDSGEVREQETGTE